MRLFVGVEISADVAAALATLIERLRQRAVTLAPDSRMTWVTPERLHVTVRFIGHVDEAKAGAIIATLQAPFAGGGFRLTVGGLGTFPPKGPPRVVWAGLIEGVEKLKVLEAAVSERLARAGIDREDRPYSPHITLARVREAAGLRSIALLEDVGDVAAGSMHVDAITLFESRLSPKGPTYVAVQRTALT
jgi:RNA 2',3'-cyclic 3'-phosphodiesterase